MRRLIFSVLSILISCLVSCDSEQETEQKSNGGLKLTAHIGGINWKIPNGAYKIDSAFMTAIDTSAIIHIAVTIENTDDDTLSFLSMMCSYEDMFTIDDTVNFIVQTRADCYLNGPGFVTLPPKHKTDRYIMIRYLKSDFYDYQKSIKIGMYYYKSTEKENPIDAWRKFTTSKSDIIWSNELSIERLYKTIYKDSLSTFSQK